MLPKAMYRVRLQDGRAVLATMAPEARHSIVRLISGSRVAVTLSNHDPGRGRITGKL